MKSAIAPAYHAPDEPEHRLHRLLAKFIQYSLGFRPQPMRHSGDRIINLGCRGSGIEALNLAMLLVLREVNHTPEADLFDQVLLKCVNCTIHWLNRLARAAAFTHSGSTAPATVSV